ncbi:MAG: hypothetical protein AUG13_06050 [Chloroflexi bacterium 13_1_20CM_2_59_7]|nr:MAG: hypothetical protein AUG13_06050 [Chloroflexi bacterium 13_1_20CM_2_59_7]
MTVARPHVMLPGQHEVHQERQERSRQQSLGDGTEALGEDVGPGGCGVDVDDVLLLLGIQDSKAFRLLAEARDFFTNPIGVFRQILQEGGRLIIRIVNDAINDGEQQEHGDGSSQATGQAHKYQQIHHRRQDEGQQHGSQHYRKHQLAPIAKTEDHGDPNGGKRPVRLLRLGRQGHLRMVRGRERGFVNGHRNIVV